RFHAVGPLPLRDEEHVLAELLPVPGGFPKRFLVDDRRPHFDVSALEVLATAEVLEQVPDHHPFRVPERRARRSLLEVEEVELRAQAPMVSPARLFELL